MSQRQRPTRVPAVEIGLYSAVVPARSLIGQSIKDTTTSIEILAGLSALFGLRRWVDARLINADESPEADLFSRDVGGWSVSEGEIKVGIVAWAIPHLKSLGSAAVECGYRFLGVDGGSSGMDSVNVADHEFTTVYVDGVGIGSAPDGEPWLGELIA